MALAEFGTTLAPVVPELPAAAEPIVLPVPAGAVKILPRWADEDDVQRWRLKYRAHQEGEVDAAGMSGDADGCFPWVEIELRAFTRELPLTGLPFGQQHYFKVALETPDGWSSWSRVVACTPPAADKPGKCAAVFAEVKDATTALIRWTKPIDVAAVSSPAHAILRYKLRVTWPSEDGTQCQREINVEDDIDVLEVGDLKPLTDYRFYVSAQSIAGWGDFSDPSAVLNMPPPVPPELDPPTLRKVTHYSAVIQWQHPLKQEAPVTAFQFRWTSTGSWAEGVEELRDVPADLAETVIRGLLPGNEYRFQVSAVNQYGAGVWSDSSLAIKTTAASTPSKIVGLEVPHIYRSFITLQWPPANENGCEITGHVVRYGHKEDMSDGEKIAPPVEKGKGGLETCNLRHLKKTRYFFQIAAVNKMGTAEWSDPISVDLSVERQLEDA